MYWEALELANLKTLFDQSQVQLQTTKLFQDICNNPYYKLHKFLPEANKYSYILRNNHKFYVPGCKTKIVFQYQL